MPKIFISYSFKNPDAELAKSLNDALSKEGFDCFLAEKSIYIGDDWAKKIDEEINSFDFFIVLLSHNSMVSDMVIEEIKRAKRYYDSKPKENKPTILPIRIKIPFNEGINYDIDGYLNKFQQRIWENETNTKSLIEEINFVIRRNHSNTITEEDRKLLPIVKYNLSIPTPVAPLEVPGGVVALNSPFYILRNGEKEFIESVIKESALLKIFAPRQYGKTSILSRIIEFASDHNHYVASLSFQLYEFDQLENLDELLKLICVTCAESPGRPYDEFSVKQEEFWRNRFDRSKRKCDKFFEQYLLKVIDKPLLLAIDEADRLFPAKQTSLEFFSLLRLWNEQSKMRGKEIFNKLKIVVAYSTESSLAIQEQTQSPFNIGTQFDAYELTKDQVIQLAKLHGLNLNNDQISNLMELLGGHPYLVRKSFYGLAHNDFTFEELMHECCVDGGPFDDHLKRQYWNLSRKEGYIDILKDILVTKISNNKEVCDKLFAAGLIKGDTPNVSIKNKLYEKYFSNKLQLNVK